MTAQQIFSEVEIKPRKVRFPYEAVTHQFWFAGNPIITAYFSAVSATFPPGEVSFIESVQHYQDQITDPELKEQVKGFIGQEAHHSHQHRRLNEIFDGLGLSATRIEKHLAAALEKRKRKCSPRTLLAATVGMEHITAILADYMLTRPEVFEQMEAPIGDLMRWHAIEEVEHKAVAFEVYKTCEGDMKHLRKVMKLQTTEFVIRSTCYQIMTLVWARKWPSWKEWKQAWRFFMGKDGLYRKLRKPYLDYFRKDFHPWDHDNRQMIEAWKARYQDEAIHGKA